MTTDKMKHLIINFLTTTPRASFVELCDGIAGFSGHVAIVIDGNKNLILWPFVSEFAKDALVALQREGKINFQGYDRSP